MSFQGNEVGPQLLAELLLKRKRESSPLHTAFRKIALHDFLASFIDAVNSSEVQAVLEDAGVTYLKIKGSNTFGVNTLRAPSDIDFEVAHPASYNQDKIDTSIKTLVNNATKRCIGYTAYYLPIERLSFDPSDQEVYKLLGRQGFCIRRIFKPEEVRTCIANSQVYGLNAKDISALELALSKEESLDAVFGLDLTSNNYPPIIMPSKELTTPGVRVPVKEWDPYDVIVAKLRMTAEGLQKETSLAKVLFDIYIHSNPDPNWGPSASGIQNLTVPAKDRIATDDVLLRKLLFFSLFDVPYTEENFANINLAYLNPESTEAVDRVLKGLKKLEEHGIISVPGQTINREFAEHMLEHTWNIFHNTLGNEMGAASEGIDPPASVFTAFSKDERALIDAVCAIYVSQSITSQEEIYEKIYPLVLKLASDANGREAPEDFADRMTRRIQKSIDFYVMQGQDVMEGDSSRDTDDLDTKTISHSFAIWVKSPETTSHIKTAMLLADELEARGVNVTIVTDSDAKQRAERIGYGDRDFLVLPQVPSLPDDEKGLDAGAIEARQAALDEGVRILKEERKRRHWDGFATELWPTAMSSHNEQLISFFEDAYKDREHPMLTYCIGRDIPGQNKSADAGIILSRYMTRLLQGNDPKLRRITEDLPSAAAMEDEGRVEYVGFYGAKPIEQLGLKEEEKEILVQAGISMKRMNEELYISALDMYQYLPDDLPVKTMRLVIDHASNPNAFLRIVEHAIEVFEPDMAASKKESILRDCFDNPDAMVTLNNGRIILQGLIPSKEYSNIMGRAGVMYTRGGMNVLEGAKANIGMLALPVKPFWLRNQKVEQEKRLEMLRGFRVDGEPLVEVAREDDVKHHPKVIAGAITQAYASAQLRKDYLNGYPVPITCDGFANAAEAVVADLQALSEKRVAHAGEPGHYVYAPKLLQPHLQVARG